MTVHPGVSIFGMKTALCGGYEQLVHCDCVHPGVSVCGMKMALCGEYEQLVHYGANMANFVEQT